MSNNDSPFDNDAKIDSDTVTNCSLSANRNGEEYYEAEEVSPLANYYVSSGKKKISKDLKILQNIEAKRLKKIRAILTEAQTSYTVDYVKQLIKLARYYSKELLDFELPEEKENIYLENVRDLENCKFGNESSKFDEIVETVIYIHELEDRLKSKGFMQKKPIKEKVANRIARKEGD